MVLSDVQITEKVARRPTTTVKYSKKKEKKNYYVTEFFSRLLLASRLHWFSFPPVECYPNNLFVFSLRFSFNRADEIFYANLLYLQCHCEKVKAFFFFHSTKGKEM